MLIRTLAAAASVLALTACSTPAAAIGSMVDVNVIDRITGETLPMYWHDGRWWVPGKPGNRYAVTLTNRSGGRTLTVISVDGVNAISGETAAHDQTGYVLNPGQTRRSPVGARISRGLPHSSSPHCPILMQHAPAARITSV